MRNTHVALVVSEDWYFLSHREKYATQLVDHGFRVSLITNISCRERKERIERSGVSVFHLEIKRDELWGVGNIKYVLRLASIINDLRPDLVHLVAMKPIMLGTIACSLIPETKLVCAVAGLGYLFLGRGWRVRIAREMFEWTLKWLGRKCPRTIVVQNSEDYRYFEMFADAYTIVDVVRGAGVDTKLFVPRATRNPCDVTVIMVSRLLRDKGVFEFCDAAAIVKRTHKNVNFVLVGDGDPGNPHTISGADVSRIKEAGVVSLLGRRTDIASLYQQADIAVLASYREGLPKSLLEAAACGLPIVACDTSGCREVVKHAVNGYLVPARNVEALADAIGALVASDHIRSAMGAKSRQMACALFDDNIVLRSFLEIYARMDIRARRGYLVI